jgi:serine/threonine-protein kinase RIM15
MLKPYVVREVTIDLPADLVESLGVGAEILAKYLTTLAEEGVTDASQYPRPPPVLCRICERHITSWWFEKHSELCIQEHTAEREVQFAQESLTEHRKAIVKVLDALEAQTRQPRAASSDPNAVAAILPEYNGMQIGTTQTPPTGLSGRSSPSSPPSRSRERPASGFGHHRARSFAVRRPIARIVELVLDLCDTALEINMPAVKEIPGQSSGEVRTQSPGSESRTSQVTQWQSPSITTVDQEQGLAVLCEDTARLARSKVDAVMRYRGVLEYSERLRVEFEILVQECIEAAVDKAARIAAGELSDSSEDHHEEDRQEDSQAYDEPLSLVTTSEDVMFPCSLEAPSTMSLALRNLDRQSGFSMDRPPSSTAASTGSSSPRGSRTPRSHGGPIAPVPLSKRASMHMESDTGAESDSSVPGALRGGRSDSPSSDLGLNRLAPRERQERKRRSLIISSVKAVRQPSPARSMPPPSSPLRITKTRVPSNDASQASQSPVTSPVFMHQEFSSPASSTAHLHLFHRRQSSTASSEVLGRPTSPRPTPASSNPQPPRAAPPSIKDFEMIKPISKGAFGSVYLAKKKTTGEYFAIKALKKADMIAKNQVSNVKAERAIMMRQEESDFVAKLYWTFSSKDHLFLVMEYLNGGDCASLLKSLGGLPEDWAKRCLAEIVLGVEHLHSRGIVHRDLKPDNFLIDQKGHLKLTDFGLSRMGIVGRQKRIANSNADEPPVLDLLKQSSMQRVISVGSSRSASFDFHGLSNSPSQTPSMPPAMDLGQPSYFSLHRELTRRPSGRSDSETSENLRNMFRKMNMSEQDILAQSQSPIEEENSGSAGHNSPDPYPINLATSGTLSAQGIASSSVLMPNLALFDPDDTSRKFVGTPDYLAPETINGVGQDELSDWWSLGCILFEFVYGYPPFHADTPEDVFQNILACKIDWPPEELDDVSPEAKDLMRKLMSYDPADRLGANVEEKFSSGGEEIKAHPWFSDINWDTLREDEASFVPMVDDPENTEYFDSRGAVLQNFTADFEEATSPPAGTAGSASNDYHDRPHDALSRVRSQVNAVKRGLLPLHIPPHVRDGRSRRLSEPVPTDDFGNFNFKNLPVLEKANKDVIQKLKAEAMLAQSKPMTGLQSPTVASSPSPSLDSSPILPMMMPLNRTMSANKGCNRPSSPLLFTQQNCSPSRASQPSSPLLVQFSTGQNHERRKTSSSSSSLSQQTSGALQSSGLFDAPRLPVNLKTGSSASSPIKLAKSPGVPLPAQDRLPSGPRPSVTGKSISSRARSQTVSSQESEDVVKDMMPSQHKRRSQVFDVSPSSSDNEDTRQKALLRVQRRRQSSRRLSQITLSEGPMFRPLDVLACEDHPVSRLVMEKLLEKLRCRTVTAANGTEALRYANSEVKFDIILVEYKLPTITGSDLARMIRQTKNVNVTTPIVAVTGYLKELPPSHFFDGLIEKPPTIHKLTEVMGRLCQWKPPPPPPGTTVPWPAVNLTHQVRGPQTDDSPTSFSSSFGPVHSSSYKDSSREDSISSSFFGDMESRTDDTPATVSKQSAEDWSERDLAHNFEGLGISSDDGHAAEIKLDDKKLLQPKRPPTEWITLKKKRSAEKPRRGSADSGDDEDEELGLQVRPRSPKSSRPRGTSKLGTEMLRTNSRGSVVSVDEIVAQDHLSPIPPPIAEVSSVEEQKGSREAAGMSATPTEDMISPKSLAAPEYTCPEEVLAQTPPMSQHSDEVTPKPQHVDNPLDPDPTPRPSISGRDSSATK